MVKALKEAPGVDHNETTNARQTILDAAEKVFSRSGYDGASMRLIANEAQVAQALIHYHFQTKDRLFEAVFERRSTAASGHRGQLLGELFDSHPHPTLEDVLGVLFIPHRASAGLDSDLNQYFQLVASLGVGSDERSKELISRYFDPIAQRFVDALLLVVPGLSPEKAVWCYLFAIGSRMQAQATNDRASRLCGARRVAKPAPFDLLIPFTAAGIRAMVDLKIPSTEKRGRSKTGS